MAVELETDGDQVELRIPGIISNSSVNHIGIQRDWSYWGIKNLIGKRIKSLLVN